MMFNKLISRIISKFYLCYNPVYFRKNGVRFGDNLMVYNRVYLKGHGIIKLGNNFKFTSGGGINAISRNLCGSMYTSTPNAVIEIGNDVGISSACIWAHERITIGNNVKIGACCVIIDNDAHPHNYLQRRNDYSLKVSQDEYLKLIPTSPIVIEDDVWVGAQCQILKGVHIGARTIIAAGSIVTKSIPEDCVAGGNPCRVIRKLS